MVPAKRYCTISTKTSIPEPGCLWRHSNMIVDLCDSDTEEDKPPSKQARTQGGSSASVSSSSNAAGSSLVAAGGSSSTSDDTPTYGFVKRLDLPGGVLDNSILARVAAVAQQSNCVGVDGRGLAAGIAEKLPYGCSYKDRRPMPPTGPRGRVASKFAVVEDRATPGSVDVRRPPAAIFGGGGSSRPIVLNMFAQYEMGAPGKYRRVTPMPADSAAERVRWFQQCLDRIAALMSELRLPSIAFPHEIGCGLAGGNWATYNQMLVEFARANPRVEVFVCRWTNPTPRPTGVAGGSGGGACFKCGQHGHWANRCPVR